MKRIKYKKQKDGTKKSHKMTSNKYGSAYYVILDETNFTYRIVNVNEQRTIIQNEYNYTNLNVVKRAIKRDLQKLGVVFDKEIRNK